MKQDEIYKLRIGQLVGIKEGNSIHNFNICVIDSHRLRIGIYDHTNNYYEFPLRKVKILDAQSDSRTIGKNEDKDKICMTCEHDFLGNACVTCDDNSSNYIKQI